LGKFGPFSWRVDANVVQTVVEHAFGRLGERAAEEQQEDGGEEQENSMAGHVVDLELVLISWVG
jgi:hypothetical protein